MSKDWKTDRTEAAIKEGTDKIMKAAQKLSEREEPLFKDKVERANEVLANVELPDWNSLRNQGLDTPLTSWEEEPGSFQVCLGTGMNQLFPEYITIDLRDDE
jgi:hypothetical protein